MDELITLLREAGFERVYSRWEMSGALPAIVVSYDDIDFDRGDISRFPRYSVVLLHDYERKEQEASFVSYAIRVANALWNLGLTSDDWLPGGYAADTPYAEPRTEFDGETDASSFPGYEGKAISAQTFYITHVGFTP